MLTRLFIIILVIALAIPAFAASPLLDHHAPLKRPGSTTPAAPDPEVVRQGGDTIVDAMAISLGELRSGTTTGYTDDYDEACPYTDSTAPDVVYRYSPTSAIVVDIDMAGSNYDTKIYLYDEDLTLIACNDDYYSDYTSKIDELALEGGQDYYLIIDGYGQENGEYQVLIEEFILYESSCHDLPLVWEEGEPPLVMGYQDAHNGGCNSPDFGNPFQQLQAGSWNHGCFHGRSGWYLSADGGESRDTDWFTAYTTWDGFSIGADADYPCYFFVLAPMDCGEVAVVESWTFGGDYGDVWITWGDQTTTELWVWVGPTEFALPPGEEAFEFDYHLFGWGDLAVEPRSWTAVKGLFE